MTRPCCGDCRWFEPWETSVRGEPDFSPGRCRHELGPLDARSPGGRPVSTQTRLVSAGTGCQRFEPGAFEEPEGEEAEGSVFQSGEFWDEV